MVGIDFSYNGYNLSDFNMMMCNPNEEQQFNSRSFDKSEITPIRFRPNHYGSKFDDVLTFTMLIMKQIDDTKKQFDYLLSDEEIHQLRSWLESPKTPTEFVPVISGQKIEVHYYGIFTEIRPQLYEAKCQGLYLTFTCDSPFGYSQTIKKNFQLENGQTHISGSFSNIEDEYIEYEKPKILINSKSGFQDDETITITNQSMSNVSMTFKLPTDVASIIVDCQNKIITDGNGKLISMKDVGLDLLMENDYNYINAQVYLFYWLSLTAGENIIDIELSEEHTVSNIEISTRYIIKSGGF